MNKNLIITIIGITVAAIGLIFVLTSSQGNDEDFDQDCMLSQEVNYHVNLYRNQCPDNFEELGYESGEECFKQEVTLFNPRVCKLVNP